MQPGSSLQLCWGAWLSSPTSLEGDSGLLH